jgi:hypothetical protein
MRKTWRGSRWALPLVFALVAIQGRAEAHQLSGGVSLGESWPAPSRTPQ